MNSYKYSIIKAFLINICLFFYVSPVYNPYAENLSGGKVSEKLEKEINEIIVKLGATEFPEIRKISDKLIFAEPTFKGADSGLYFGYFFVDENLFENLSYEEKLFKLAWFYKSAPIINNFNSNIKKIHWTSVFLGIAAACGTGYFLESKYNLHWYFSVPISFVVARCFRFVSDSIQTRMWKKLSCNVDSHIVKELNCVDGAINYLNRLKKLEPDFIKLNYPDLDDRIENLENIKRSSVK